MGTVSRAAALIVAFAAAIESAGGDEPLPKWLPPLTSGGPVACPEHDGTRAYRSEVVQFGNAEAFVESTGRRNGKDCRSNVILHLTRQGEMSLIDLPVEGRDILVDFSADGAGLLVARELEMRDPNEMYRNTLIASVSPGIGAVRWWNVWDVLQWRECDATVEAQGYTDDGRAVLRVRPSVMSRPRRPDCVAAPRLYAVDMGTGSTVALPDATAIKRNGAVSKLERMTCATDPDLVGACFRMRGRLMHTNGGTTTRIWRIGTKRILGVQYGTVPENIGMHFRGFDDEVTGDLLVCPLTRQRPGVMQMVCVEDAKNVTYSVRQ